MQVLYNIFSYTFLTRALIVGVLVCLCASLLGVSLVLRRYSMIGDGLSHVGFGALSIAACLNTAQLPVTIIITIISAFFILKITQKSKLNGDSIIAVISTGALAIGVMFISLTKGINTDLNNYLFGSILAMSDIDMIFCILLSIIVLILFIVFYNRIFSVTFDEDFSKATGINTDLYNMLLAILTAITIVLGMRLMGAMLISSLIIFPALSSMQIFKTFKSVTIFSAVLSVVCYIIGFILSYILSAPTGASIVCVNLFALIISSIISKIKKV